MQLDALIGALKHPDAATRVDVARVLGMVEETGALDALRAHYLVETDAAAREAMEWAGRRIYAAQQRGYSTLEALFEHFNITREIEHTPDEAEAELLRQMQHTFDKELQRMQEDAVRRRTGTALVAGLGGMLAGGALGGVAMMSAAMYSGADVASSSLSDGVPVGARRTPATAPSTLDISIRVRRLREGADARDRELAALELAQLNNPRALPHLAAAFLLDPSPQVRAAAERCGKILYWSAIYWRMERSGEIEAEIRRRIAARGSATPAQSVSAPTPAAAPPASEPDVSAILRRAQEGRARRNKKV